MINFPNPTTTTTTTRDYRAPQRSRDLLIAPRTQFGGADVAGSAPSRDLGFLGTSCRSTVGCFYFITITITRFARFRLYRNVV